MGPIKPWADTENLIDWILELAGKTGLFDKTDKRWVVQWATKASVQEYHTLRSKKSVLKERV